MALTTAQKEWLKWTVWILSLIGVFVRGEINTAVYKTKLEIKETAQDQAITKWQNEQEQLLTYIYNNEKSIIRITTWIEYDTRVESGSTEAP